MKARKNIIAALSALSLTLALGCVGDLGTGEGPLNENDDDTANDDDDDDNTSPVPDEDDADSPEAAFLANVAPMLDANCGAGGAGCHATTAPPVFLSADAAQKYPVFIAQKDLLIPSFDKDDNRLIANGTNGHQGSSNFDANAIELIKAYIEMERLAAEASGDNGPSPLAIWSGCMDRDEWSDIGVGDAWADKGSQDGDCDACHNLGAEGFMATNQDTRVLNYITQSPSFMQSYFYQDSEGVVQINRPRLEMVALQQAPHEVHPRFDLDGGNAMSRLQQYYDLTAARLAAGNCGPPQF